MKNKTDKITVLLTLLLPLMLLITSCKNEFEINAEYEDINVIYAIIDPAVKTQYIRINRAFLTEGNALVAASVADSSNYPYKLIVKVEEYNKNNQLIKTYGQVGGLDTVHLPKNNGAFNVGMQPYYFFEAPGIFRIDDYGIIAQDTLYFNPENKFKLIVENPVNGNISESETYLIPGVTLMKPASKLISFVSTNNITGVEFKTVPNGKIYEAKYIFFYREVNVNNPSDTILKQITWNLGTIKSDRINGGEDVKYNYVPHTFFNILKQRIPADSELKRFHGKFLPTGRVDVQLIITIGTLELSTYIDANKPSSSVIQDRPLYSNVSNGIGLFSSKRILRRNLEMNAFTVDSLRNGSTAYLNFQ